MTKSLSDAAAPALRRALGKQAPAVVELIKNWPSIVGAQTAKQARCRGIRFPNVKARTGGSLQLEVEPAAALFIQQDQVRILAKVNAFLGPDCVTSLALKQRSRP